MVKSRNQHKESKREDSSTEGSNPKTAASTDYVISLSQAAEAVYENYYSQAAQARARGDITNAHFTTLRMIDEVLEQVIPRDPFNKKYALQGSLSGIFRMKKGRLRICWVGSSKLKEVCVIFISETLRKAGDANDIYERLKSKVRAGEFAEVLERLGLSAPPMDFRTVTYLRQ